MSVTLLFALGVTGVGVTPLASLSGCFLPLGLVLGAASAGLPVQPVAQHTEFWGRRSPAALRLWGAGAAPRLGVLVGAPLTAAAERKDRCRSHSPLLLLWPHPALHAPSAPPCLSQASAFLFQVCLAGAILKAPAVAGHSGSQAPGVSTDRLSPALPLLPSICCSEQSHSLGSPGSRPLFCFCF